MIQRDANAFVKSEGALEIRHFTSEMRPSSGCGAERTTSLNKLPRNYSSTTPCKINFLSRATLKSSFAIQWGA
jgi:hypothetical protein